VTLREIRRLQKRISVSKKKEWKKNYFIKWLVFQRVMNEIVIEFVTDHNSLRVSLEARMTIQEATKDFMINWMRRAYLLALDNVSLKITLKVRHFSILRRQNFLANDYKICLNYDGDENMTQKVAEIWKVSAKR